MGNDFNKGLKYLEYYYNRNNNIKLILIALCILYIISPFDFIPEIFPMGRIDDVVVLLLGLFVASQLKFKSYIKGTKENLILTFKKDFPDIQDKYNDLLKSIGNDEKYDIYKSEAAKVYEQLLKVHSNIIESNQRIENFKKLKDNLVATLNTNDDSPRVKEGIERSKELISRIEKEDKLLREYISEANEEIKATRLDFIHVTTEIELAKSSGQLIDLVKLSSRSKSLSYLASNLPTAIEFQGNSEEE